MIYYRTSCLCVSLGSLRAIKAGVLQRALRLGFYISCLTGCFGGLVKLFDGVMGNLDEYMPETPVYATFTSVVGFMLVFRSGQSYARFTEGATLTHVMQADFLDSASLLMSLSRQSSASLASVLHFRRVVVRLISVLNMLCLSELGNVEVPRLDMLRSRCIDLGGLDDTTLQIIEGSACKADAVCQLLQNAVTDALKDELANVPAPLLSRFFQEIGGGMIKFHEALKLSNVPSPFPMMVVTEVLLLAHCIFTPLQMSCMAKGPVSAALFSAVLTFCVWTLYGISGELDDPFGTDVNDLDLSGLQEHLNHRLLSLLANSVAPKTTLCETASDETHLFDDLVGWRISFEAEKREDITVTKNLHEEARPRASTLHADPFMVRSGRSLVRVSQSTVENVSPPSILVQRLGTLGLKDDILAHSLPSDGPDHGTYVSETVNPRGEVPEEEHHIAMSHCADRREHALQDGICELQTGLSIHATPRVQRKVSASSDSPLTH